MAEMWAQGSAYELFMGRWSRLVAPRFLAWLDLPSGLRWADVGCGTGALTATILERADPSSVLGVEPSAGFLTSARENVTDPRATFRHGSTEALAGQHLDVVVAGLVLNFLPDVDSALTDFVQAVPGGTVAAYVWDYQDGNQMLARFWRAATEVAGHPVTAAENTSFALFQPAGLTDTWERAGLREVATGALEIEMVFADFDDYWSPFLGGQGPAPSYAATLDEHELGLVREALREDLAPDADGRIRLTARAWAVRGEVSTSSTRGKAETP
jgi:SAM-dependent methyltransferase